MVEGGIKLWRGKKRECVCLCVNNAFRKERVRPKKLEERRREYEKIIEKETDRKR